MATKQYSANIVPVEFQCNKQYYNIAWPCFFFLTFTLTVADISEPPCSFAMVQYQAFSDDLYSAVCVPDVILCDTLSTDLGSGNFMTILLAQLKLIQRPNQH